MEPSLILLFKKEGLLNSKSVSVRSSGVGMKESANYKKVKKQFLHVLQIMLMERKELVV